MRLYSLSLSEWNSDQTINRRFYKSIPDKKDVINFLKENYHYFFFEEVDDYLWEKLYGKEIDTFLNSKNFQLEYEKGDINTISYYKICDEDCLTLYLEETEMDNYKNNEVSYKEDFDCYEVSKVYIMELSE